MRGSSQKLSFVISYSQDRHLAVNAVQHGLVCVWQPSVVGFSLQYSCLDLPALQLKQSAVMASQQSGPPVWSCGQPGVVGLASQYSSLVMSAWHDKQVAVVAKQHGRETVGQASWPGLASHHSVNSGMVIPFVQAMHFGVRARQHPPRIPGGPRPPRGPPRRPIRSAKRSAQTVCQSFRSPGWFAHTAP